MRLRKAIIPAAGRGTRMRPFSDFLAKELVPLGSTPALDFVLREAATAGFDEIGLIVREGKESLGQFVGTLEEDPVLRELTVETIEQPNPTGLADALLKARDFTADEAFAVLLPDNVLLGEGDSLSRLRETFEGTQKDVLGFVEVPHSRSGEFGNCGLFEGRQNASGWTEITQLIERGSGRLEVLRGETVQRTCGRFIARPHLHDYLEQSRRDQPEGELDERPAHQAILTHHGLVGCPLLDPLFDVGHPNGVLAASAFLHDRRTRSN